MIFLPALQRPLTSSSSDPDPDAASDSSSLPPGNFVKRPLSVDDVGTQETLREDERPDLPLTSAGTASPFPPSIPTLDGDTTSSIISSYSQKRRLYGSQRPSQANDRSTSPPFSQTQVQTQELNPSVHRLLHKMSNTLLELDSDQRSHRRKTEKILDVLGEEVVERMKAFEEGLVEQKKVGEGWKDRIVASVGESEEKIMKNVQQVGKEVMEQVESRLAEQTTTLKEVQDKVLEKVGQVEERCLRKLSDLEGRYVEKLAEAEAKHEERARSSEKELADIKALLQQLVQGQSQAAQVTVESTSHDTPLEQTTLVTPRSATFHTASGGGIEHEDELADMALNFGVGEDTNMDLTGVVPHHSDAVVVDWDKMPIVRLPFHENAYDIPPPADFHCEHYPSGEHSHGVDPKYIMIPPRPDDDMPSASASTTAARMESVKHDETSRSVSSKNWWTVGEAKTRPQTDEDKERHGNDSASASEERVVTPGTATEEQFHTASPDVLPPPDLAGEDEQQLDDESDSSRPPARRPFPPRTANDDAPPSSQSSKKRGRPRNSDITAATLSSPKTELVTPQKALSTKMDTLSSRKSQRVRRPVTYMDEDSEVKQERKRKGRSKSASAGAGGPHRRFYGKVMLATKGLLAGDGVKKTEGKWPSKGAYTVRSKLEEIVCDACRGRCHWACAALDIDADMSNKSWLCPDCEYIVKVDGKPRASIDTVQQVRCIRYNCVLRDKKAIEVREGEEDIYIIEKVVGQRATCREAGSNRRIFEYLIKWDGYGWDECSWEPVAHLAPHQESLIATFRETAQETGVDLKPRVGILHEARDHWDAVSGNSLDPDDQDDGDGSAMSESASASASGGTGAGVQASTSMFDPTSSAMLA